MSQLSQLKNVHIIGCAGTLMGAFAVFLKRSGVNVTGSDLNIYPPMSDVLRDAGVEVFQGYDPSHITKLKTKPDLVVIGNVIPKTNPEARVAIDGGLVYASLPETLEKWFLPETKNLVVCGTHGKTTTSSLLTHVLREAAMKPSWFIGGVSASLPFSFSIESNNSGAPFVLEGDEYDTAFWDKVPKFFHYLPDHAILTSVEFDHADIYANLAAVKKAFEGLLARIRPGGHLIACADYENVRALLPLSKSKVITYGLENESADYLAKEIKIEGALTHFTVFHKGKKDVTLSVPLPGRHNVANALSVYIEAKEMGLTNEQIQNGFSSFKGIKRRQEERGEKNGILVIDDFAHHPTAVRETLSALKKKYAGRRLVTVFEPRSATSRRKVFQKEYAAAFQSADEVWIAKPFDQSKIEVSDQFSSEELIRDISALNTPAHLFQGVDDGVKNVRTSLRPGDVVAVLSNGGFDGFIDKLLKLL